MSDIKIDPKPGETVTVTVDSIESIPIDQLTSGLLHQAQIIPNNQHIFVPQGSGNYRWVKVTDDDRGSPDNHANTDGSTNRDDGVPTDVRQTREQMVNIIEQRDMVIPLELRQGEMKEDDKYYIFRGLASRTDTPYKMYDFFGEYDEVIDVGAFKNTLNQNPKVILNVNHAGLALASTKATPVQTLRLWEDGEGLQVEARIRKGIDRVEEIVTGVDDGNIDEMSFAFRVQRQKWSPDYMQRNIMEVNLHRGDVSIVTYGANPNTSTSIRDGDDPPDTRNDDTPTDDTTADDQPDDTRDAATDDINADDSGDTPPPTDPPDTSRGADDGGGEDDDDDHDHGDVDDDQQFKLAKQREQKRIIDLALGVADDDIHDDADNTD